MDYPVTARNLPTRKPDRARYDRATVHAVLDEALYCHVGFVRDGRPAVLPTIHARVGDVLYLHASTGTRLGPSGAGPPVPAEGLAPGVPVPAYLTDRPERA